MADLPKPSQTLSLADVIRSAIFRHLNNVRVSMPGRVESYDPNTQQVTVQPLIHDIYYDEDGSQQSELLPVITGVPVVFLGSGGFSITWPIARGDTVLLLFSSSSLDRWLVGGGETDPRDPRRHALSDAIAIPGLRDFGHPVPAAGLDASKMVISGNGSGSGNGGASPAATLATLTEFLRILGTTTDAAGACATLAANLTADHWPDGFVSDGVVIK